MRCGHGKLFGPGNAQLPLPPMLMFDRIVSISETGGDYGKGQIQAELDIKPDMWFFECHFESDPVTSHSTTSQGHGRTITGTTFNLPFSLWLNSQLSSTSVMN